MPYKDIEKRRAVRRMTDKARRKKNVAKGLTITGTPREPKAPSLQNANALAAFADPLERTLAEIAEEAGVTKNVAQTLIKNLRSRGLLLHRALGEVSKEETRKLFEFRAHQILSRISEEDILTAPLRDKMLAAAVATDKALLLSGQPTEILSIKQLDNLDELTTMLLSEMQRRKQIPNTNEATQTVILEHTTDHRNDPTARSWEPSQEPA